MYTMAKRQPREAGRGQSRGVPSSGAGGLSTTELCYRKLIEAALKRSFTWDQARNERAEAGRGKERTGQTQTSTEQLEVEASEPK